MIVELGGSFGGGGPNRPFEVLLKSPNEDYVLLKGEDDAFQTVYDDSTSPPPAVGHSMAEFIDDSSPGDLEAEDREQEWPHLDLRPQPF